MQLEGGDDLKQSLKTVMALGVPALSVTIHISDTKTPILNVTSTKHRVESTKSLKDRLHLCGNSDSTKKINYMA